MLKVFAYSKNQFNSTILLKRNMSLVLNKCLIDGNWISSSTNKTFDILNPANGEVIGSVPNLDTNDAEKAIQSAKNAFYSPEWSGMTAKNRSNLLKSWYNLIEKNRDEIAKIMTMESGKPINESQGEVTYGNSFVEWFAEEARRIYGEIIPSAAPNRELFSIKQPIGVAALITPWNFPLAMITRKAAAALAAGCTIIIKPAEDTPLTALALTKLAEEAGFPKGVINIITTNTSPPIGDLLCKSPDVGVISFTGSTEVGKLLYKNCAGGIKRVALELGGNAPFIVFNSADVDKAVQGAIVSKFRNCGQTCVSANRFFIQNDIYCEFIEKLTDAVKKLKIGLGSCADTQIGPLINKPQMMKVSNFVEDAKSKNAKVILGGKPRPDIGELFYEPTIITNLNADMKLYQEEVFGPIISIIKFNDEEEALQMANNVNRGLAGYFYSQDIAQVFRVARKLEVGMIGVNEGLISTAEAPFGGLKESGIGREGGHQGIDEYVNIKYMCLGNLKN